MQDWDSGFFKFPSHSYSRPGEYEREKGVCSRSTERGSTHWLLGSAQGRPGRCIGANPGSVFAFLLQLGQGAFLFPQSPRRHFTSRPLPVAGCGRSSRAEAEGDATANIRGLGPPPALTPGRKSSRPSFLGQSRRHCTWSPRQHAWARGHRPGSFSPRGSQGPWSPQLRGQRIKGCPGSHLLG